MLLSITASIVIQYPYLNRYMVTLAWVVSVLLGTYGFMRFFIAIPRKTMRLIFSSIFIGLIVSVIGVHRYEVFRASSRIEAPKIAVYDFQPFQNRTSLARLDHTASFKVDQDLMHIDGIAALYPVYAAFVEATSPDAPSYDPLDELDSIVRVSTSENAYERLINGEVDIIFVEPPTLALFDMASQNGVELSTTIIGYEAPIFFVHQQNPLDNLTLETIIDIYSGAITNWSALNGIDANIEAFQRVISSGSQTALTYILGDVPLMTPPQERAVEAGTIVYRTARYHNHPHAIGFSLHYYARNIMQHHDVKLLTLEGVEPNVQTIRDRSYPIVTKLVAVTAGSTNPHIVEFIAWILSSEGQHLIEQTGFVPVKP